MNSLGQLVPFVVKGKGTVAMPHTGLDLIRTISLDLALTWVLNSAHAIVGIEECVRVAATKTLDTGQVRVVAVTSTLTGSATGGIEGGNCVLDGRGVATVSTPTTIAIAESTTVDN